MRITSWIDTLKSRLRTNRRAFQRTRCSGQRAAVERLEDRTLLSVTSLFFNGDLTIISDGDDAIVVHEDPLNAGKVEILVGNPVGGTVTLTPDTAIGSLDADTVQTINVQGGDSGNNIDLSGVDTAVFTSLVGVTIDGNNGDDTISGSANHDDVIDGGHGEDVITVGIGSQTIDGGHGDDTITGGPSTDVINGGDGNDVIDGGAGSDTINAGNGHDVVNGGDESGGTGDDIIGGHGHDTIDGGAGSDTINGKSGNDEIYGGDDSDTLHGGSGSDLLEGGDADDKVNGHGGNDTIRGNAGNDRLNGHWGHDYIDGDDTLASTQGGNDTLFGGTDRDTLVGNQGDDYLKGQGGRDTLIGNQGLDKLDGGGSNDVLRGFHEQVVYLDFESQTDTQTEYEYSGAERTAIQDSLETAYGSFDVSFTQTQPTDGTLFMQSGAYATITFNETPSGTGIGLGGAAEASEYDFRNTNLGGTVSVDVLGASGLLGGTGQPAPTSQNIIAASSYAAAHELGYLLGLRQVDSFGPISATHGITGTPGATAFSPIFPGPISADETFDHLMGAPGLLGSQFDVVADHFFGERSAIKLAFNESGLQVVEQNSAHSGLNLGSAQPITLRALGVPTTLDSGLNADSPLNVEAAAVVGATIGVGAETDVYSFEGAGGQLVSIEVFSDWLDRVDDPVDTIVRVFDVSGNVLPYFSSNSSATDVAVNDGFDNGSGTPVDDPVLINLVLPDTGNASDTYFIQVSEPSPRGLFVLPTDNTSSITELDPVTGVELSQIPLPAGESSTGLGALAYDGTSDVLYFINGARDVLYEIDPDDGTVLDSDAIVSPINTSPGAYDGLAVLNGEVYILDVTAETIPGQAADQNNNIPQILDPPEILVFDPVGDTVVRMLNLVGTGEGPLPGGANLPGTFADITGGLAAIDPSGTPALLLLDSRGTEVHEIDPASGVSTGNFSPAGAAGIYEGVAAFGGNVHLGTGSSNNPPNFFSNPPITSSADGANSVVAIDLDGDGDTDVVSASGTDDTIAWHENDGSENFTAHVVSTDQDQPKDVEVADVDGDGDIDIVFAARTGNTRIGWYENDGNQVFTLQSVNTTLDDAWDVFVTDVDGDGDVDLLSASAADETVAWYENDGSQAFTMHSITTAADGVTSVFAIDVDSDGDVDVLSASIDDDEIDWYENDGSQNFTSHTISSSADRAKSVFALDMDGDGDIDVVSASEHDDKIAWYENDGSENFTEFAISTAADDAESVYAVDLDGDGDIDVLSASDGNDEVAWYENIGGMAFTPHSINTSADGAYCVYVSDVNGDGLLDVLSASNADDTIAWYQNSGVLANGVSDSRIDIYSRGNGTVQQTLRLSPAPLPAYNLTAIGNNDNNAAAADTGAYELFITKVDLVSPISVTVFADTLIGGAGNDSLHGSSGSDLQKGGSGDDKLYGLGGNDLLNGGSGYDVLRAGADNDTLLGGSGTDRLYGGGHDDLLDGQAGDDKLDGEAGDDTLKWLVGNGSDIMNNTADSAQVQVIGSNSADTLSIAKSSGNRPNLTISDGADTVTVKRTIWMVDVNGGNDADTLTVGNLEDVPGQLVVVNGDNGDDIVSASGKRIGVVRLRLEGGNGDDTLTGSLDADTLWGGDGNDRIRGGDGNDIAVGGLGDDDIDGQDDDDILLGNEGNDTLNGSDGDDSLSGHDGDDTLNGGNGHDSLEGGDGDDTLSGKQGDDSLAGDAGMDKLYGGIGDDYLNGGLNEDSLYGNYGDDTIGGGHGHDLISGSQGDDIINGGDGNDTIDGGEGADGISGHDGHDQTNGGGQDDTIIGGDGDDDVNGGGGRDIVLGGDGDDTINGQGAEDTLAGNEGADVLTGSPSEINENFSFYASWVDSV